MIEICYSQRIKLNCFGLIIATGQCKHPEHSMVWVIGGRICQAEHFSSHLT